MKCSTAYKNPRASNPNEGVIICYCGPPDAKDALLGYGENLVIKIIILPN